MIIMMEEEEQKSVMMMMMTTKMMVVVKEKDKNFDHRLGRLITQWVFTRGVEEQMKAFMDGFNEVVPLQWLQYFDEREMEVGWGWWVAGMVGGRGVDGGWVVGWWVDGGMAGRW